MILYFSAGLIPKAHSNHFVLVPGCVAIPGVCKAACYVRCPLDEVVTKGVGAAAPSSCMMTWLFMVPEHGDMVL